jgi:hypothetical protein
MGPVRGPRGFAVGVVWTACDVSDVGNEYNTYRRGSRNGDW